MLALTVRGAAGRETEPATRGPLLRDLGHPAEVLARVQLRSGVSVQHTAPCPRRLPLALVHEHGPSYRTIDFTAASVVPRAPFERTVDVFGDGALTLCATPGHTAGHLSLIARLEGGEALLSADAAYTMATIRDGERPWLTHDRKAFEHSLRQIQAYDRENPDALIIPGHDMKAWTAACERLSVLSGHR